MAAHPAWSCHAPDGRQDRRYPCRQVGDTAARGTRPVECQPEPGGADIWLGRLGGEGGAPAAGVRSAQLDPTVDSDALPLNSHARIPGGEVSRAAMAHAAIARPGGSP